MYYTCQTLEKETVRRAPRTKSGTRRKRRKLATPTQTFETRKEARFFTENLGSLKHSSSTLEVPEAVDRWLRFVKKIGRDGRETVEPETLKEYRRRAERDAGVRVDQIHPGA